MNPFRVGLFSWSLFSHKILRWNSGIFAIGALVALGYFYAQALMRWPQWGTVATLAAIGVTASVPRLRRGVAMCLYFGAINVASLVGVWRGTFGRVSGVWSTRASMRPQAAAWCRWVRCS
jgi:hypothetical protein